MSQDEIAKYMNAGVNEGNNVAVNEGNVVVDNSGRTVKKGRRGSISIMTGAVGGHIDRENEN